MNPYWPSGPIRVPKPSRPKPPPPATFILQPGATPPPPPATFVLQRADGTYVQEVDPDTRRPTGVPKQFTMTRA